MSSDNIPKTPSPLTRGEGWGEGKQAPTSRSLAALSPLPTPQERSDIAILVSNLGKCYQIYDAPRDRLKQFIIPRLHRLVGKTPKQYFREFWALKGVSFEVRRGETVGIIGRNGSGKSTLLQLICGTLTPTSGSVETHGRVAALLELGSGFNPEFTGRENVYMNAAVLGLSKEEVDARFDDIAAFADIGQFIEQPVKTYSSGMYLRLAFSVIAHVNADILVIDEALAVGDVFFSQKCMRFLRNFRERGTILFVSHDSGAVVNLCQRAIWLEKGAIRLLGTSKSVTEHYLAAFYESQQGTPKNRDTKLTTAVNNATKTHTKRDQRLTFINCSNLRNDLEVFTLNPDASAFGIKGATIQNVRFTDSDDNQLTWIVGGENVVLEVEAIAHQPISNVLVGFFINDRLGQTLFGDNTFLTYADNPVSVPTGGKFVTRFQFTMPILPRGEYTVTAAIAEGTQHEHIQHHWIHNALLIKSHSSSVSTGLVGIMMNCITIATLS